MCNIAVAPLVGAWIEIPAVIDRDRRDSVAPLVGAWIEMVDCERVGVAILVAPLVGAWIEITNEYTDLAELELSLLSWERGLKSCISC